MALLLWHVQLLLTGATFGALLMLAPRAVAFSLGGRFLLGLATAPYLIAGFTLAVAALHPVPPLIFAFAPLLLNLAIIIGIFCRTRGRFLPLIGGRFRRGFARVVKSPPMLIAFAGLAVTCAYAFPVFSNNFRAGPVGGDATVYLAHAQYFAGVRDSWALPGPYGLSDGSLRGDIHGPVWSAYLASALAAAGLGQPAATAAAPSAILITVPLLALAIFAALSQLRQPSVPAVAVLFLLFAPVFAYVTYAHSRDAFRLIPVVLTLGALAAYRLQLSGPGAWRIDARHLLLFALGAMTGAGHAIGVFVLPLAGAGWLFFHLCRLPSRRWPAIAPDAVKVAASLGLGLTVAYGHLFVASIAGHSAAFDLNVADAVAGTPYEGHVLDYDRQRILNPLVERFPVLSLVWNDNGTIFNAILIFIIIYSVIYVILNIKRDLAVVEKYLLFFSMAFLAQMMLPFGLFDLSGFELSKWVAMNPRYSMHIHLIAAVLLSLIVFREVDRLAGRERQGRRALPFIGPVSRDGTAAILSGLAVSALVAYAFASVADRWRNVVDTDIVAAAVQIDAALAARPRDCRMLSEVSQMLYYSARPRTILSSTKNRDLYRASSAEEISELLRARNVCAILAYRNYLFAHYPSSLPMKAFVEDGRFVEQTFRMKYYVLYILRQ